MPASRSRTGCSRRSTSTTRAFEHGGQAVPGHRHSRLHPPPAAINWSRAFAAYARGDARRRPHPPRRRRLALPDGANRGARWRAVASVLERDRRRRAARSSLSWNKIDSASMRIRRRRLANRFPDALQVSASPARRGVGRATRAASPLVSPTASSRCFCSFRTPRAALLSELYGAGGSDRGAPRSRPEGVYVRARFCRRARWDVTSSLSSMTLRESAQGGSGDRAPDQRAHAKTRLFPRAPMPATPVSIRFLRARRAGAGRAGDGWNRPRRGDS